MWTLTALAALTFPPQAPAADPREAVIATALAYAESYYERAPENIERNV